MSNEKDDIDLNRVVTELLLRISTLEKLLIDKKVFTNKEYNSIFEEASNKVLELMKEQQKADINENNTIFIPATVKNKLEN